MRILVSSTFEKEVAGSNKDYLIEFYAPWCAHCKLLEPIYQQLAEKNQVNNNLIIAKFDASQNDIPKGFRVEGYPMIFYVPAGKRDAPVPYRSKERTVELLQNFIDENSSVFLTDEERRGAQSVEKEELWS